MVISKRLAIISFSLFSSLEICNARSPFFKSVFSPELIKSLNKRGGGKGIETSKAITSKNEFEVEDISFESILKGRTSIKSAPKGLFERLVSPERFPYTISFVVSMIYFYFFVTTPADKINECKFYKDGFCVTNLEINADGTRTCPGPNSHIFAWNEDIIFTVIAIALPFTKYSADDLTLDLKVAIPLIIFGHGFLHYWISNNKCYFVDGSDLVKVAEQFYKIFVGCLTGIMFFIFSDLPQRRPKSLIVVEVLLITQLIVKFSLDKVKDGNAISTLFLVSQLLIGYLGAVAPGPQATKLVGQTFIFPCIVSLIEFLNCDFLNLIGGHFWYDFFLHISVLASLLPADLGQLKAKA